MITIVGMWEFGNCLFPVVRCFDKLSALSKGGLPNLNLTFDFEHVYPTLFVHFRR